LIVEETKLMYSLTFARYNENCTAKKVFPGITGVQGKRVIEGMAMGNLETYGKWLVIAGGGAGATGCHRVAGGQANQLGIISG
jgi:hypothetical protein